MPLKTSHKENTKKMPSKLTVERSVVFCSDLETVNSVLLDTANYPEFIQNISAAEVISQNENESEVSFKAKISLFSFEYSIKTTRVSANLITFEQQSGFFNFLSGEWRLTENHSTVNGSYVVQVKLPRLVAGRIVRTAINLYFPSMLNDFKDEVERRFREC